MTVPSWQYVALFLPAACLIHWLVSRRSARAGVAFLILASFAFYALVAGYTVLVLIVSVIANGFLGWLLLRPGASLSRRRVVLSAGIVLNIAMILWVRGPEPVLGMQAQEHAVGLGGLTFMSIGVSFFSLQQIAFLFDCHRGVVKAFKPSTFCLTSVFFPHLLAGPIVRYRELAVQIEAPPESRAPAEGVAMGLTLLTVGAAKHVILAQPMRQYLSPVIDSSGVFVPMFPEAALILLALTLFIYFDFSAYSDMACGAACLMGYRMPVNFLSPLRALNVAEFWRRWHITLSRFMRDYVFLPINSALTRAAKRHRLPLGEEVPVVAGTMATFLAMGLWHGVGETFMVWGLSVGMLVSVTQVVNLRRARRGERNPKIGLARKTVSAAVIALAMLSTISLFTSHSLEQAVQLMRGLVGLNGISLPASFAPLFEHLPMGWFGNGITFRGWFPESEINAGFDKTPFLLLVFGAAVIGYGLPNVYQWLAPYRAVVERVPPSAGIPERLRWRPVAACGAVIGLMAMAVLGMLVNQRADGFLYFRF